jgi:hypothetical protein
LGVCILKEARRVKGLCAARRKMKFHRTRVYDPTPEYTTWELRERCPWCSYGPLLETIFKDGQDILHCESCRREKELAKSKKKKRPNNGEIDD